MQSGLQRTVDFIAGRAVDRVPFHPIVMRWAARHAGVKYRDFCRDWRTKTQAMIQAADDFGFDWVTVLSDPWCEATAFGIELEYPEDSLPVDVGGQVAELEMMAELRPFHPLEHARCANRVEEVREFRRTVGGKYFIVGWVEGPVAEYADLRGASNAAMDFLDDPAICHRAMDVIISSAKEFITCQIEAGADCVGIGDAFCSQIGPVHYREFAWQREKELVDHIHSLGALAKLHICGNVSMLLPDMIATGADIIDIDHLVPTMADCVALLKPGQVFSGKTDPVSVIQNGTPELIAAAVRECREQANERVIVSAGCEITPDTSDANMRAFRATADN